MTEFNKTIIDSKAVERNENGYPLLPNGEIDWELTGHEKDEYFESCQKIDRKGINPYTQKKKKRKKKQKPNRS